MIPNPFPPESGQHSKWASSIYSKRLSRVVTPQDSKIKKESNTGSSPFSPHQHQDNSTGISNIMPWSTDKDSRAAVVRGYSTRRQVVFSHPVSLGSSLLADVSSAMAARSSMIVRLELNNITVERNLAGDSGLPTLFVAIARARRLQEFILCNIGPLRLNEYR
jgi:hypothetical protein